MAPGKTLFCNDLNGETPHISTNYSRDKSSLANNVDIHLALIKTAFLFLVIIFLMIGISPNKEYMRLIDNFRSLLLESILYTFAVTIFFIGSLRDYKTPGHELKECYSGEDEIKRRHRLFGTGWFFSR